MRVLIGGLIHDRPQVECYLRHLARLDMAGCEATWCFDLDDVDPGRYENLWPEAPPLFLRADPGARWERRALDKEAGCFDHLAAMRNQLRDVALVGDFDYLLSVDSDIIIPPDLLHTLLAADKPWVSALVSNREPEREDDRTFNVFKVNFPEAPARPWLQHFQPTGTGALGVEWPGPEGAGQDPRDTHAPPWPLCVGAVCLYRRDLLERARFRGQRWGEDVGFAQEAFAAGFTGWYLPRQCEHLMTREQLAGHRAGCPLC